MLRFLNIALLLIVSLLCKESFAQYLNADEYLYVLKSNLQKLNYSEHEVLSFCEDISFSNLSPESDLVEIGNEGYSFNNVSYDLYFNLQSLDYITKCKMLFAMSDFRSKLMFPNTHLDSLKNLEFLPFLISVCDKNYNNSSTAYGFWALQFMPALRYGLQIDTCYDERLSFEKSSLAAGSYLINLHQNFNYWNYSILAYICGPTALRKAMINSENFDEVLEKIDKNYNNYFYYYLAIVKWFNENEILNPAFILADEFPEKETVIIKDRFHFGQISEVLDINLDLLKQMNPLFVGSVIDGRKHEKNIYLPSGKKLKFEESKDSILHFKDSLYFPVYVATNFYDKSNSSFVSVKLGKDFEEIKYTIKSGDNLGSIAQKFGVKISEIQEWNNIKGTNIYAGKIVSIWVKKVNNTANISSETKPNNPTTVTKENNIKIFDAKQYDLVETIVVQKGDSFYKIAKNYSWASAEDIMLWNGISDASKLQVGQSLKIYKKK